MSKETNLIQLSDGRKLAYAEYGDPEGKSIFYFHGWPSSRLSGSETNQAAKKLKVRVISPDRPGFGLSDYQENRTLLTWADDVEELADQLKIQKFAVVGVSGGGPYLAACAYKLSDRITKAGIIVGLGPVNVKHNLDNMAFQARLCWANYHRFPLLRTLSTLSALIGFRYLSKLSLLVGFRAIEDQEAIKKWISENNNPKDEASKEAFRQGIKGPNLDLKLYTDNWGFKLQDIKVKTYLWYGAKDKNVSLNMGKYYKLQIPNSELFIDKNGGHLFRYKHEAEILKTLTE